MQFLLMNQSGDGAPLLFIYSFIDSFVRSFVRSFVLSFFHSSIISLIISIGVAMTKMQMNHRSFIHVLLN